MPFNKTPAHHAGDSASTTLRACERDRTVVRVGIQLHDFTRYCPVRQPQITGGPIGYFGPGGPIGPWGSWSGRR